MFCLNVIRRLSHQRWRPSVLDRVILTVQGGPGGRGLPRLKGRGGKGGNVYLFCQDQTSLRRLAFSPSKLVALKGDDSKNRILIGARGRDLKIPVPCGTKVISQIGCPLGLLEKYGQELMVAEGGDGGSERNHYVPQPGEQVTLTLELLIKSHVCLVGFPNAGKSSLFKVLTNESPTISHHPFNTLSPNLGIIQYPDQRNEKIKELEAQRIQLLAAREEALENIRAKESQVNNHLTSLHTMQEDNDRYRSEGIKDKLDQAREELHQIEESISQMNRELRTLREQLEKVADDTNAQKILVVDLPGLSEDAHKDYGLGNQFLRHATSTKLLVVVVDINGYNLNPEFPNRTAFETILILQKELEKYQKNLLYKPAILLVNKMDCDEEEKLKTFKKLVKKWEYINGTVSPRPSHGSSQGCLNIKAIIDGSVDSPQSIEKLKILIRKLIV